LHHESTSTSSPRDGPNLDSFQVRADADKVRYAPGNRLTGIVVAFQLTFPASGHGDGAWAILPDVVPADPDKPWTRGQASNLWLDLR
jgi:hypothetical protein